MNRVAWHFLRADWTTYGNGTDSTRVKIEAGKPLVHVGQINPCYSGLHASVRAIDALSYSHGPVVTLVECEGEFADHGNPVDKFACRKRTALWGYDCMDELWTFARVVALDSLEFWPDAPAVVREFLETGNEDLRAAAWDAAWDAARAAAWAAAWDAARAAARDAAWDAARAAAWDAARAAARDAAWAARLDLYNQILESILLDGAVSRGLVTP